MKITAVSDATLAFLQAIKDNNNRPWFTENKERFQIEHANFKAFVENLRDEMSHHDNIENHKVYRIYRDVRFSKNKIPYKTNFGASLVRATKWLRGGYYFQIEPGNSFAAGGFWSPNTDDLKRIRQELLADHKPLQKIINSAAFKKNFETLKGSQLKTAPRGYDREHPAIALLRHKQFLVVHPFTDDEVTHPKFVKALSKTFKAMRPFFNYMSEVLTTDENGVPID